jgi:hypothetical protein
MVDGDCGEGEVGMGDGEGDREGEGELIEDLGTGWRTIFQFEMTQSTPELTLQSLLERIPAVGNFAIQYFYMVLVV